MREAQAIQKQHAENGISEAWQRHREILGCRLEEAAMKRLPNLSVYTFRAHEYWNMNYLQRTAFS
jgi:hypothetical protein